MMQSPIALRRRRRIAAPGLDDAPQPRPKFRGARATRKEPPGFGRFSSIPNQRCSDRIYSRRNEIYLLDGIATGENARSRAVSQAPTMNGAAAPPAAQGRRSQPA